MPIGDYYVASGTFFLKVRPLLEGVLYYVQMPEQFRDYFGTPVL
jgi:hypothetical protein